MAGDIFSIGDTYFYKNTCGFHADGLMCIYCAIDSAIFMKFISASETKQVITCNIVTFRNNYSLKTAEDSVFVSVAVSLILTFKALMEEKEKARC